VEYSPSDRIRGGVLRREPIVVAHYHRLHIRVVPAHIISTMHFHRRESSMQQSCVRHLCRPSCVDQVQADGQSPGAQVCAESRSDALCEAILHV
jgi:hypothetical protein